MNTDDTLGLPEPVSWPAKIILDYPPDTADVRELARDVYQFVSAITADGQIAPHYEALRSRYAETIESGEPERILKKISKAASDCLKGIKKFASSSSAFNRFLKSETVCNPERPFPHTVSLKDYLADIESGLKRAREEEICMPPRAVICSRLKLENIKGPGEWAATEEGFGLKDHIEQLHGAFVGGKPPGKAKEAANLCAECLEVVEEHTTVLQELLVDGPQREGAEAALLLSSIAEASVKGDGATASMDWVIALSDVTTVTGERKLELVTRIQNAARRIVDILRSQEPAEADGPEEEGPTEKARRSKVLVVDHTRTMAYCLGVPLDIPSIAFVYLSLWAERAGDPVKNHQVPQRIRELGERQAAQTLLSEHEKSPPRTVKLWLKKAFQTAYGTFSRSEKRGECVSKLKDIWHGNRAFAKALLPNGVHDTYTLHLDRNTQVEIIGKFPGLLGVD